MYDGHSYVHRANSDGRATRENHTCHYRATVVRGQCRNGEQDRNQWQTAEHLVAKSLSREPPGKTRFRGRKLLTGVAITPLIYQVLKIKGPNENGPIRLSKSRQVFTLRFLFDCAPIRPEYFHLALVIAVKVVVERLSARFRTAPESLRPVPRRPRPRGQNYTSLRASEIADSVGRETTAPAAPQMWRTVLYPCRCWRGRAHPNRHRGPRPE